MVIKDILALLVQFEGSCKKPHHEKFEIFIYGSPIKNPNSPNRGSSKNVKVNALSIRVDLEKDSIEPEQFVTMNIRSNNSDSQALMYRVEKSEREKMKNEWNEKEMMSGLLEAGWEKLQKTETHFILRQVHKGEDLAKHLEKNKDHLTPEQREKIAKTFLKDIIQKKEEYGDVYDIKASNATIDKYGNVHLIDFQSKSTFTYKSKELIEQDKEPATPSDISKPEKMAALGYSLFLAHTFFNQNIDSFYYRNLTHSKDRFEDDFKTTDFYKFIVEPAIKGKISLKEIHDLLESKDKKIQKELGFPSKIEEEP